MSLYHVFGPLFFGIFCPSFFCFFVPLWGIVVHLVWELLSLFFVIVCPSLGNCFPSFWGFFVPLFWAGILSIFFWDFYTSFVRIVIHVFCEFVSLFQVRPNSSGDQVRFRRRFRRRSGRLWCRARSGWEALVQSQVRFNRVPEKVPEKVWHP